MAKSANGDQKNAIKLAMATLTNGRGIVYAKGDTLEFENYDYKQSDAKEALIEILHNGVSKIIKLRNLITFGIESDTNEPAKQVEAVDIINNIMDGKVVTITKTGTADAFASKGQDEEIEGGINWRGKWYKRNKNGVVTVLEIKAE